MRMLLSPHWLRSVGPLLTVGSLCVTSACSTSESRDAGHGPAGSGSGNTTSTPGGGSSSAGGTTGATAGRGPGSNGGAESTTAGRAAAGTTAGGEAGTTAGSGGSQDQVGAGMSGASGDSGVGGSGSGAVPCDETKLVAFPCAEGYGKIATGGRGGKVYEITTLNATGEGSLGAALAASGPRTIVFRVGGTIKGDFKVSNGDVTLAGQTAPGDGIEINGSLSLNASNLIIRYIRVRGNGDGDVITGSHYNKSIIIDHVSASYSSDEVFSVYWDYDITVQWSIISEAVSADHKFGGIWGGERASYHHNLFAHNTDRNPRISSGSGHNDVRNNVVYNWQNETIYGGERIQTNDNKMTSGDGCWVNVVGNYFKPGPGTPPDLEKRARICSPWTQKGGAANYGKWYVAENVVVGNDEVTKDNWKGVFPVDVEGKKTNDQASIPGLKLAMPTEFMPIRPQTAEEAYKEVLAHAGCSLPVRDPVDQRIIEEVRTGTATKGNKGFVSSVGETDGHPVLKGGAAPPDTDHDGMPDAWESANGLKPNDPSDGNATYGPGYTMLEKYLNSLDSF